MLPKKDAETKRKIARDLLGIQAVYLRHDPPFTWASGIKSPIYCDNRLTLTAPRVRNRVETAIAATVQEKYPQCDVLMGTSTAGIAHAAIAAYILGKPMGYVRGKAKDHGRENRIEGSLKPREKVVVIEDLISTGGSAIEVVETLREAGAEVLGIISIFTYGMDKSARRLQAAQVENTSLTDYDTLLEVAAETGYIEKENQPALRAFMANPDDPGWMELLVGGKQG